MLIADTLHIAGPLNEPAAEWSTFVVNMRLYRMWNNGPVRFIEMCLWLFLFLFLFLLRLLARVRATNYLQDNKKNFGVKFRTINFEQNSATLFHFVHSGTQNVDYILFWFAFSSAAFAEFHIFFLRPSTMCRIWFLGLIRRWRFFSFYFRKINNFTNFHLCRTSPLPRTLILQILWFAL